MEIRSGGTVSSTTPGTLRGYAAVYNSMSRDLGGFFEIVTPGAFDQSLKNPENIIALFEHDTRQILGRCGSGTLKLFNDSYGLGFELILPDTSYAKDLTTLVERGDITGCSFGFRTHPNGDNWQNTDGKLIRSLVSVELFEITVSSNPAYLDTSVARRNIPRASGRCLNVLFLETVA